MMKKVFKLENLDCANCARKMEDAIRRIEGVEDVQISFLTQKITLVAGTDQEIIDLIREDASAYFAGAKSLDETVKIIQGRVVVPITEN